MTYVKRIVGTYETCLVTRTRGKRSEKAEIFLLLRRVFPVPDDCDWLVFRVRPLLVRDERSFSAAFICVRQKLSLAFNRDASTEELGAGGGRGLVRLLVLVDGSTRGAKETVERAGVTVVDGGGRGTSLLI
jgi:hypothetical protein